MARGSRAAVILFTILFILSQLILSPFILSQGRRRCRHFKVTHYPTRASSFRGDHKRLFSLSLQHRICFT